MSKFLLIDHSLTAIGGHHYEYAVQMLKSAACAGYEPILACGQDFEDAGFPAPCEIHRLFPYPSYGKWSRLYDGGLQLRQLDQKRNDHGAFSFVRHLSAATEPLRAAKLSWRRKKRMRQFVAACQALFERLELRTGDHVFFPTMSEFDMTCLAALLREAPESFGSAQWHAQMHIGFWDGRQCDAQDNAARIAYMRQCLGQASAANPAVELKLYATTVGLAEQYNQLGAAEFTALPYPANASLWSGATHAMTNSRHGSDRKPIRIVVAGKPRAEKGTHHLESIVDALWDDYFSQGRAQLVVQSDSSVQRWTRNKRFRTGAGRAPAIEAVEYPLSVEAYANLIKSADIGLFLYDSSEYYSRASGVLVEMLAAGKPVITPAACWLSEQTDDREENRLNRLGRELGLTKQHFQWTCELVDGQSAMHEQLWPEHCNSVLWQVHVDADPTAYARIEIQAKVSQEPWSQAAAFVTRGARTTTSALTLGLEHVDSIRIRAFNAFDQRPIGIQLCGAAFEQPEEIDLPLGDASLSQPDCSSAPRLLADMLDHIDQYQQSARRYAQEWAFRHHAMRTIEILTQRTTAAANPLSRAA